MHKLASLLAVVAVACGSPTSSPIAQPTGPLPAATPPVDPTTLQPVALPSTPPSSVVPPTRRQPPPPPPLATCISVHDGISEVAMTPNGIAMCLAGAPDNIHDCWEVSFETGTWTALPAMPTRDVAPSGVGKPIATREGAKVSVCDATGLGCQTITVGGLDKYNGNVGVEASSDRELVVVYRYEDARVFDVKTEKLLSTTTSWVKTQSNPVGIQMAHFVGGAIPGGHDVLEVLAQHSPVSGAARLYDPRTGKAIGGTLGKPDQNGAVDIDESSPIVFGDHEWLFSEFPMSRLFVQDIRTGKLVKTIDMYDDADRKAAGAAVNADGSLLARSRDGKSIIAVPRLVGAYPPVAIELATGKVRVLHPPRCK